jgi:hypothetical protein
MFSFLILITTKAFMPSSWDRTPLCTITHTSLIFVLVSLFWLRRIENTHVVLKLITRYTAVFRKNSRLFELHIYIFCILYTSSRIYRTHFHNYHHCITQPYHRHHYQHFIAHKRKFYCMNLGFVSSTNV